MSAIFTGTRSRTHSKQVPNERGTSQEGFKCIPEVLAQLPGKHTSILPSLRPIEWKEIPS